MQAIRQDAVGHATSSAGAGNVSSSSDTDVETIRKGTKWNLTGSDTLSYSFYNGNVNYKSPYAAGDPNIFSSTSDINDVNYYGAGNQAALREVMQAWDKAVDFDFTEITETSGVDDVGEIRFAFTDGGASGGPGWKSSFCILSR